MVLYSTRSKPCKGITRVRWTDHKTVGLQYGLTALFFLLVGFLLMILMRWQLAWPGQPLPAWLVPMLGEANAPGGIMSARVLQPAGRHARLGDGVPRGRAAGGIGVRQLLRSAADWRERRWRSRASARSATGCISPAALVMLASFFVEGGAPNSGWTSYVPLAVIATAGPELLARRDYPDRPVVHAWRHQHARHHRAGPRAGHDVDEAAVLRLVAACYAPCCCCSPFPRCRPLRSSS